MAIGVAAAYLSVAAAYPLLQTLLYGGTRADAAIAVPVAMLLVACAMAAAFLPTARRVRRPDERAAGRVKRRKLGTKGTKAAPDS